MYIYIYFNKNLYPNRSWVTPKILHVTDCYGIGYP